MGELNHRIKDLIIKHLQDELTIEDQLELREWINVSDYNRDIFRQLTDPDQLSEDLKEYLEAKINIRKKIDVRIKTSAIADETPVYNIRPIRRHIRVYVAAAAIIFLFITSYIWLASRFDSSSKARPVPAPIAARDVAPGGNKATLTLSDGSSIVLENAADGHLTEQSAAHVSKQKDALSYTAVPSNGAVPSPIVYNILKTPRAGQFQVVLPDGTKVWLNNASSLRYPTSFSGTSREVELTGEGYFEVAKNVSKPFTVKVPDGAVIHVLGTSFNVMAYNDEPEIRTTLLEGSVKIKKGTQSVTLQPGQQVQSGKQLRVIKNVDVEESISWKNGLFQFHDADIETVMRSIARWYDLQVSFTEDKSKYNRLAFFAVRRDNYISDVLLALESSGYHFKMDGNRIIVLP